MWERAFVFYSLVITPSRSRVLVGRGLAVSARAARNCCIAPRSSGTAITLPMPDTCGVIFFQGIERAQEYDTEYAPVDHDFAEIEYSWPAHGSTFIGDLCLKG